MKGLARSVLLRWSLPAALAALLTLAAGAGSPARAQWYGGPRVAVSISYFYDDLAPYGAWVNEPGYGWCWSPYAVATTWRPYMDGYWAYTDWGWTWVSYEPWGWAAYHYGRWFFDPMLGWVWVPGTVWAPAWVAWRWDDDYDFVGWAPLPPDVGWTGWVGVTRLDVDRLPAQSWCFAPARAITQPTLVRQLIPAGRNPMLLRRTTASSSVVSRMGKPFDRGVSVAALQQHTGRGVPRMRIADLRSVPHGRGQVRGAGAIGFFRPAVHMAKHAAPPRAAVVDRARAGHGGRLHANREPGTRGHVMRPGRGMERMPAGTSRVPEGRRSSGGIGTSPPEQRHEPASARRAHRPPEPAPPRMERPQAERAPARMERPMRERPAASPSRAEAGRGRAAGPEEMRAARAPARAPAEKGRGGKPNKGG